MHMQAGSDFAARFLKSDRVGFYLRVLQEGALAERDDDAVTIAEFLRIYTTKSRDPATLERVLAVRSATRGAGVLKRDCKHPSPDSERAMW